MHLTALTNTQERAVPREDEKDLRFWKIREVGGRKTRLPKTGDAIEFQILSVNDYNISFYFSTGQ